MMIITKLLGGLGNQMFQYACGRALAEKHKTQLKLDISIYEDKSRQAGHSAIREYELGAFNISASVATPQEIARFMRTPKNVFRKAMYKIKQKIYPEYSFQEKEPSFDKNVLDLPNNMYLSGYWHSEQYFINIKDVIKQEFSFRNPPLGLNNNFLEDIKSEKSSVSLHIRRQDFVKNDFIKSQMINLGDEYYEKAIQIIAEADEISRIFIFSDEPEWCEKKLHFSYPMTIVSHNSIENGFEDLRLMSTCKHNIIANSSFSWWGAWLNNSPEKIVIAPRRSVQEKSIWHNRDFVPNNWIKI